MTIPPSYSFIRYLASKRTVDDRALNRNVWNSFSAALPPNSPDQPVHILEVGAGIGTMIERLVSRRMFSHAVYTAVDADPANILEANRLLAVWGPAHGLSVSQTASTSTSTSTSMHRTRLTHHGEQSAQLVVETEAADVFAFLERAQGRRWDVLIAHAFLDLLDLPTALPRLLSALKPGGLFYFTLNFDGSTILEPAIDRDFDAEIERLYHRTMDERLIDGQPSGDSQSGRHLFHYLRQAGARIIDAGSSDWVVFADGQNYPADEAYFLHFIIQTMHGALQHHPALADRCDAFQAWVTHRHRQIERGELVYIAHQLDFVGQVPG